MEIKIIFEYFELETRLLETPTARAIYNALPHEAVVQRWGGELYFPMPVDVDLEPGAVQDVEVGSLAFFPTGRAFCMFFGRTPASITSKPRAFDLVNIFGEMRGNIKKLDQIVDGDIVKIIKN
jgi:hypothetical protein